MPNDLIFDWDESNAAHIAVHGVLPHEAEEAFRNHPIPLALQLRGNEQRARFLGQTLSGRFLQVVATARAGKIRIVTAWPANRMMREFWLKERSQ